MKKLLNDPADLVADSLHGFAAAHGDLVRVSHDPMYIVRADAPVQGKVGVLSGGGSGHEPMHGGFVGLGMLDVACPGEVFTSPTPDQMLRGHQGRGRRRRRAAHRQELHRRRPQLRDGGRPRARGRHRGGGRRSPTTTWPCRTASTPPAAAAWASPCWRRRSSGAAAEEGKDLAAVAELCRRVNAEGRSMGMALTSCTVPAAGKPTFELGEDEMEIGIGIHGEPGRERLPLAPAREIVGRLADADPRRPALRLGRPRAGVRQRHGRHAR